jgi:glutaminase
MSTAGLDDDPGIWFYNSGVPAKSGVGGCLIAVVPENLDSCSFSSIDKAGK